MSFCCSLTLVSNTFRVASKWLVAPGYLTLLELFLLVSHSECASLDVFIRKSCDERCKHGLDGIFFHLRFHPTSSSLSLSLSLSLSRIYKVINYFSLLFNTTANLWSVVFDTTPASLICRCRHFSGAIQTCLYAPQILLVPLASNTAAWNCAKPLIVQSFLLLSLFSFYRNFSRFFKRMNGVICI